MFKNIKKIFERISPISIDQEGASITVGLSRRFLLFDVARKLVNRIEDDPYLNFISTLKAYKAFGNILTGTIHQLHRDRNRSYMRYFFVDQRLYNAVKKDLEWVYERNKDLLVTITKRGVIIYDNYKQDSFNTLLMTPHSGTWMPRNIENKQTKSEHDRMIIEDTDTQKIYGGLVIEKGGIWIDSKLSRFACDFNRDEERAIYENHSENWIEVLWKENLTRDERRWLMQGHKEFYYTLEKLINSYRFNIIFDGHSMKDAIGRPEISFGTQYIPHFYMPVVISMKEKLKRLGYKEVVFNQPFSGGHILKWMHNRFPDVFVFSVEINKRIYMAKDPAKSDQKKLDKLAKDITNIFDVEVEI